MIVRLKQKEWVKAVQISFQNIQKIQFVMQSSQQDRNRPYICPCGKTYRSYPALFTHIKQKHDGEPPGSVVRPKSHKRGRPRKHFCDNLPNSDDQFKNGKERQAHSRGNKIQQNGENGITLLRRIRSGNRQETKKKIYKNLYEILQFQKDESAYSSISQIQKLIIKNEAYAKALNKFNKRLQNKSAFSENRFQFILLQFLQEVKYKLPSHAYANLQIIISLIIYFYSEELDEDEEITAKNYVKHLNTFIFVFIEPLLKFQCYNRIFSLETTRLFTIITIFQDWLLSQNLTNYAIDINMNYFKRKDIDEDQQIKINQKEQVQQFQQ